jgi:hypothetical protein
MSATKEAEMDAFRVESIRIKVELDKAFGYLAAPENLPHWTHAFKSARNGEAVMATPTGTVAVGLKIDSSPAAGTIDWCMKFPDGNEATAYSRLVRQSDEAYVYSFVLFAPPAPLERLEGALKQQAEILREELERLKQILESA